MEYFGGGSIYFRPNRYQGIGEEFACKTHTHNFHHNTYILSRTRVEKWKPAVRADGSAVSNADGEEGWLKILDDVYERGEWVGIEPNERHRFTPLPEVVPAWLEAELANMPDDMAARIRQKWEREQYVGFVCMYSHRNAQGEVVMHAPLGIDHAYL